MYCERHVVSGDVSFIPGGFYLGLGYIVCPLELQQRGQWLGDLGPASREVAAPLVDDVIYRRNPRSPRCAKAAGPQLNQLRIRHSHEGAVVAQRWKIRTLRNLLRLLFL